MTDSLEPNNRLEEEWEETPEGAAGYSVFAQYYDALTTNIAYETRGEYFHSLLQEYAPAVEQIVDLACGTGSLSYVLYDLGYQVIGVDASAEMLVQAQGKKTEQDILFLQQSMQQLQLHTPVDAVICALDSINHLPTPEDVKATFQAVGQALTHEGVFLFDVNTLYKHKEVLGQNAFVYETEDVFCVWQNYYEPSDHSVEIWLDFFLEQPEGSYLRAQEEFSEQYYSQEDLTCWLKEAGFRLAAVYHEDSRQAPNPSTQRLVYVAHKQ